MLIKPLISEKTMILAGQDSYTFLVDLDSTKYAIANEIKDRFGVDVLNVRTIVLRGKRKTQRSRKGYFTKADRKKAIVMLKKGQSIPMFEEAARGGREEEVAVETAENPKNLVKEKKSLLTGTKVKIEKGEADAAMDRDEASNKRTRQQAGKTKGEK